MQPILHKNRSDVYEAALLTAHKGVVHGFTTRRHGDMRQDRNVEGIIKPFSAVLLMNQVHSTQVLYVSDPDEQYGRNGDAMVMAQSESLRAKAGRPCLIGVLTADCVPLLFYDPVRSVVAIGHAGWKGTLAGVSRNIIRHMAIIGSQPKDILVIIGPYIHACCYNVPYSRAELFKNSFVRGKSVVSKNNGSWYLDLGIANSRQLLSIGIQSQHIQVSDLCTSCRNEEFFSYRKDTRQTFGEMLSFIGFSDRYGLRQ